MTWRTGSALAVLRNQEQIALSQFRTTVPSLKHQLGTAGQHPGLSPPTRRWAPRSPRRKHRRYSWPCPSSSPLSRFPEFTMPETIDQMVVDHPHGLHKGVADRAAHEREATPLQVLTHGVRFRGLGRDLPDRPPGVLLRLVANESPNVLVERAEVSLHGQERLGILGGGLDLQPVADDPGVCQQALALLLIIPGDDGGIEVVEGSPVVLSFLED